MLARGGIGNVGIGFEVLALGGSVGIGSEVKWRRSRGGVLARGGIGGVGIGVDVLARSGNGNGNVDKNFGICNFGICSFGIRNLDVVAAVVSVSETGVEGRMWNAEATCRPTRA